MNTIIGNELVKKRLQRLLDQARVPHLMLFSGPEGVGKKCFAKAFAAMWLSMLAKKSISQTHPDISCITPEGKSGMHSIASIRRCQDEMYVSPFEAPGKVLIIDDAERMLPTSANTLLKTLEEPPKNCLIILVSSAKDRILNTILSRCQEVRFAPCTNDEVISFLQTHCDAAVDYTEIALRARGSIGKALRLCEKDFDDMQGVIFEFLSTYGWRDFHRITELAVHLQQRLDAKKKDKEEELFRDVKDLLKEYSAQQKHMVEQEIEGALTVMWMQDVREIFHCIIAYFRDQLALECNGSCPPLYNVRSTVQDSSVSLDRVEPLVQKAMQSLERSTPFQHVLETFFVRLSV